MRRDGTDREALSPPRWGRPAPAVSALEGLEGRLSEEAICRGHSAKAMMGR